MSSINQPTWVKTLSKRNQAYFQYFWNVAERRIQSKPQAQSPKKPFDSISRPNTLPWLLTWPKSWDPNIGQSSSASAPLSNIHAVGCPMGPIGTCGESCARVRAFVSTAPLTKEYMQSMRSSVKRRVMAAIRSRNSEDGTA